MLIFTPAKSVFRLIQLAEKHTNTHPQRPISSLIDLQYL